VTADVTIRRVAEDDAAAAAAYVAIRNEATPDSLDSLEQLAWARTAYPGDGVLLLAEDASGAAVGTASSAAGPARTSAVSTRPIGPTSKAARP